LVVNHSLLVLKNFDDTEEKILVIDEAHELDEALVKSLTSGFSVIGLMRLVASIRDMLDNDNKNMLDNVDILSIERWNRVFRAKECQWHVIVPRNAKAHYLKACLKVSLKIKTKTN